MDKLANLTDIENYRIRTFDAPPKTHADGRTTFAFTRVADEDSVHNVLAVAGALSFAVPSSAAIIDSEAAQIDTIDVS